MGSLTKIRAPRRLFDGGKSSGGGDNRFEVWVCFCSGVTVSVGDLRWVPPWEVLIEKLGQNRMNEVNGVAPSNKFWQRFRSIGDVRFDADLGIHSLAASNQTIVDVIYFNDPLFVALEEGAAEDVKLEFGVYDGIRNAQIQISGGDLHREAEQGSSLKMNLKARDTEVSRLSNTHKFHYRVVSGLRRGADLVGGFTFVSIVACICGLKSIVGRVICQVCETWCNVGMFRARFNPRRVTLIFSWLVDLIWNDFRRKRDEMEVHNAYILDDVAGSVNSFSGLKVVSFGWMVGAFVLSNLLEWLKVDQVRISSLTLFSGSVHPVHLRRDMCLFSVKSYIVFIPAKHVPVQCVWNHCSSLGWSVDYICYYQDDCVLLNWLMFIVVLEVLSSRNLIRIHSYRWIPLEAYLAARGFVKASLGGSYPVIRVFPAPSQSKASWMADVDLSFCSYDLLYVWFVAVYLLVPSLMSLFCLFGLVYSQTL